MLPGYAGHDDHDDQYESPAVAAAAGGGAPGNVASAPAAATAAALGPRRPSELPAAPQQVDNAPFVYMMTVLSALGGFLFGYDTGIVSGAMVFVKRSFHLNSLWQEVVVSVTILGAWACSLMAGSLSERHGRKRVIVWASVVFALGSFAMALAWSKYILMIGRLIVGCAIGLSSPVIPLYIAEVAPTKVRGSLVALNTCFITFGQLSAAITAGAFSYDQDNGWRWMLGLAALPALIQFAGFLFMPESPRWLVRQRRLDEALKALRCIRGRRSQQVGREFERMRLAQLEQVAQESRRRQQKRGITVAIFRKPATRRALSVGCLLMAAQQLSGINTVMYYTATIIEMSGVQSQSIAVWLAVPTAAVFLIFSLCGFVVADRLGRRTLTLSSLMGVIGSLIVLGTGFHLTSMKGAVVTHHNMSQPEACFTRRDCNTCVAEPACGFCYDAKNLAVASCLARHPDDTARSQGGECAQGPEAPNFLFATHICPSMNQGIGLNTWLVLLGLVMYLASFALGLSPMPWTINSEIYPNWARSNCYSIATSINWLFNMLVSFTFITLTELLTTHGVFYLYAIVSSFCWLALFWLLPETRGRSLEDIGHLFARPKAHQQGGFVSGGGIGGDEDEALQPALQQPPTPPQTAGLERANLAFAAGQIRLGACSPSSNNNKGQLDRNRSFELANQPLAKTSTSLAVSQPDLQRHYHGLGSNTPLPPPPPPPVAHNNNNKRKYSDGGAR